MAMGLLMVVWWSQTMVWSVVVAKAWGLLPRAWAGEGDGAIHGCAVMHSDGVQWKGGEHMGLTAAGLAAGTHGRRQHQRRLGARGSGERGVVAAGSRRCRRTGEDRTCVGAL